MFSSLLTLTTLISYISSPTHSVEYEWVLATSRTGKSCYRTKQRSNRYFSAPKEGQIVGTKWEYVEGADQYQGVMCKKDVNGDDIINASYTKWGCSDTQLFMVELMDSYDHVLYPPISNESVSSYPLLQHISMWSCDEGCSVQSYNFTNYTNYNVMSDIIEFIDTSNPYTVGASDQTYSLEFSAGCCDKSIQNYQGVGCAAVYFAYITSTGNPTSSPSKYPSKTPTKSPIIILNTTTAPTTANTTTLIQTTTYSTTPIATTTYSTTSSPTTADIVGCDEKINSGMMVNECGLCLYRNDSSFNDKGKDCNNVCFGKHHKDQCGQCLLLNNSAWNHCLYTTPSPTTTINADIVRIQLRIQQKSSTATSTTGASQISELNGTNEDLLKIGMTLFVLLSICHVIFIIYCCDKSMDTEKGTIYQNITSNMALNDLSDATDTEDAALFNMDSSIDVI